MKIYSFGAETAPVILLLPGICCHWKSNFGKVIPLLSDTVRVLCVSYDGFDETERTEFSGMIKETEKSRHIFGRTAAAASVRLMATRWAARSLDCWRRGRGFI